MRGTSLAVAALVVPGLLLSIPGAGGAEPTAVPDWVRSAPGREAHPDDDGLLLRQHERVTLDAEGKVTRRQETALKMLQEWVSRQGMLDPRIDWNDARSELRDVRARTYMRDGKLVEAAANSFVPNTAAELQGAVAYAAMREMVVAHVGVEHGSTSILEFTIADRKPSGVPLWGIVETRGALPVLEQSIVFEVPEGTPFRWASHDSSLRPEVATRSGSTTFTFARRDVAPANLSELAGTGSVPDRLVYSTARDWAAVREWIERRVEAGIVADDALRAKVEEVLAGSVLDAERIARLHAFVVDGIQTAAWPVAAFDYAVRPAGEVLRDSVGHPLDKAVLLAAMLRAAGFDARVALASFDRGFASEVPCPVQLGQVWVRVGPGTDADWLDPTAPAERRNRFHLAGRPVLVLDGRSVAPAALPELDAGANRAVERVRIELVDGGRDLLLAGTTDLDLGGLYNPIVSFDRSKERAASVASPVAASFGGAKVGEVVVARQSAELTALRAVFSGGSMPVPKGGLVRVTIPRVPGAVSGTSLQTWRERRSLPLVLPAPAREVVEISLALPETLAPAFVPSELSLTNAAGSLTRTVRQEGRSLTVRTELSLTVPVVDPASYPDLRALYAALDAEGARTILLRRGA